MKDKAERTIRDHRLLSAGACVVVGFSGGADSTALLHFLQGYCRAAGVRLLACHLNHLLRGAESFRDERFAAACCRRWGIPLVVRRVDVGALAARHHQSVELAAREARQLFFRQMAACYGAKIATAHTLDDRAETMLLNLCRGTGLDGLCAIQPAEGGIIRPLVFCTRAETEGYCRAHGLAFVTDSTNLSDRYARNRIRHHLLPALRAESPAFDALFARMVQNLSADKSHLEAEAAGVFDELSQAGGLGAAGFAALDDAIAFRVFRRFLAAAGEAPSAALFARARALAEGGSIQIGAGRFLVRRGGWLRVEARQPAPDFAPIEIAPGDIPPNPLGHGRLVRMDYEQFTNLSKNDPTYLKNGLDYDKIDGKLVLRTRQPGDYMALRHRGVGKPLRRWMNDAGIPPAQRDRLAVLADGIAPVWADRFGVERRVAVTPATKNILVVYWQEAGS